MTSLRWRQALISYSGDHNWLITLDPYASRWVCADENGLDSALSSHASLAKAIEWCEERHRVSNDSK